MNKELFKKCMITVYFIMCVCFFIIIPVRIISSQYYPYLGNVREVTFDPIFLDAALEAINNARILSPNDPKVLYNIAILNGYKGNNDVAMETLKETIAMKKNYKDAYYALYVFYTDTNQPDLARGVLQDYLTHANPNDKEFQELLNQ